MILGLGDAGSLLFIEHVHALADEERKHKFPAIAITVSSF